MRAGQGSVLPEIDADISVAKYLRATSCLREKIASNSTS